MTAAARARGHEVYLHLPMEPIGSPDPGPNAILVGLEPDELRRRLGWAFDRVPLATGVNNHMGSRATSEPETMLKVLQRCESAAWTSSTAEPRRSRSATGWPPNWASPMPRAMSFSTTTRRRARSSCS